VSDVELLIGGTLYTGWKSVDVRVGVDRCAGSFELDVSDSWSSEAKREGIPPGSRCEVRISGEPVITGWVDEELISYDANNHSLRIVGRDAAGDLVDCSAIHQSGQWINRTIAQIAEDLCAPFDISVRVRGDVGERFRNFYIDNPGDTVYETLLRAARHRGLLLFSDGLGGLVIGRPSKERIATPIVLGQNVIGAHVTNNQSERFSDYIVVGQGNCNDETPVDLAAETKAQVSDGTIARYRPLIIPSDETIQSADAQKRAVYERRVREANCREVVYTVKGWSHEAGIWRPDRIVAVRDDFARVRRDLYIAAVRYRLDDEGSTTELTTVAPGAYDVLAVPELE
jgi:prophage tail gpP-like protein